MSSIREALKRMFFTRQPSVDVEQVKRAVEDSRHQLDQVVNAARDNTAQAIRRARTEVRQAERVLAAAEEAVRVIRRVEKEEIGARQ